MLHNGDLKGEKRREKGEENIFEEIMDPKFPNLVNEMNFYFQYVHYQPPSWINIKRHHTWTHYNESVENKDKK